MLPDPAPAGIVATVLLIGAGVVQNLSDTHTVTTIAGQTQHLPGGAIASQEAIKEIGTNGGGPYNANSAHPFENPNAFTNLLEIALLLLIPFALPRTFGKLLGDKRQGWAILAAMSVIFTASLALLTTFEARHSGYGAPGSGCGDGGQGGPFRRPVLGPVRQRDHPDVDRRGGLDARLVHAPGRWRGRC